MKTSFKRLTCLFLSILMLASVFTVASAAEVADTATGADTIYVDTTSISTEYAYYAWVWPTGGDGSWKDLTKSGDYYQFQMEKGYNVLFAAFAAGTSTPVWDTQQAKTGDTSYDGTKNYCKLTLGGNEGLAYEWAKYSNGAVVTTPKPVYPENDRPSISTTAPKEEDTFATHPIYEDENEFMYIAANSNLDKTGVKVKLTQDVVTVVYELTADKILDGGQAVITYDSNKLALSTTLNTNATMFPNLSGVMSNLGADVGKAKFNFSGINNDFTDGKVFVKLVFERKYNNVGTADVNLEITDLSSKELTYIEDGEVFTTEGVKLTTSVDMQEVQEPSETAPVETDATTDITIRALSNADDKITEIKADKATVKVTYNLTAEEFIAYGYGSVTFDENVLALEDRFNNVTSIFTTVSSGVSYNLNAAPGRMKFAFTGIDVANQSGLYDFTTGSALVTLVFTVKSGATGTTDVMLNLEELGSIDKEYASDSAVDNDANLTVVAEGVAEEATTAEPTKPVIATGVPTTDTSEVITTAPTSSSDTTPTSSSSQTEPTTPSTKPTTKPTQPATKAPSLKVSKTSLKAGKTATASVSNKNGKTVKYSTSKKTVVKIDSKTGKMTALRKGTVYVYAKIGGKTLKKKVKVTTNPIIKYKKKTFKSGKTITLNKGKKATLYITGKASKISNKVTVKSKKIAKITSKKTQSKVVFKALKKGKTTITVKVNGVKSFKYTIKVK